MKDNTDIKDKRLALLEETAKHYTSKNRCYVGTKCQYSPLPNISEGCAIGRLVDKETSKKLDAMNYPIDHKDQFDVLPTHLKVLGEDFLRSLQKLHDNESFWNERGLSVGGRERYNSIVKLYCI